MSTIILTLATCVGLGALYVLVASGLSLIYGLMHVLNFAHGAFLTLSAFLGWMVAQALGTESWWSFLVSILVGAAVGALFATLTELVLIRPLYERHIEQVLVTVGLSFAAVNAVVWCWDALWARWARRHATRRMVAAVAALEPYIAQALAAKHRHRRVTAPR